MIDVADKYTKHKKITRLLVSELCASDWRPYTTI